MWGMHPILQFFMPMKVSFLGSFHLKTDVHMLEEASVKASSRASEIDRDVRVVTKEMRDGKLFCKICSE